MAPELKSARHIGEQGVWDAVFAIALETELDADQRQALRGWAGTRLRDLSFSVFEPMPLMAVRKSFIDALRLAAGEIKLGRDPDATVR